MSLFRCSTESTIVVPVDITVVGAAVESLRTSALGARRQVPVLPVALGSVGGLLLVVAAVAARRACSRRQRVRTWWHQGAAAKAAADDAAWQRHRDQRHRSDAEVHAAAEVPVTRGGAAAPSEHVDVCIPNHVDVEVFDGGYLYSTQADTGSVGTIHCQ
jgi:hypothetical protein